MKLLIAEDDLTSRTMLEAITRKWGYEPVAVEDGEAACEIMREEEAPRLLLLDWEMPKLSGLELCHKIRKHQDNHNPPFIILLTARRDTDDIVTGLKAGANEYISKPFDNAELQARLLVGSRMLDLQSEQIEAGENQAELQRQLQQAQKMEAIGQLTGGIAHDFNNMLASIMGFTELSRMKAQEIGDSDITRYLDQIHKSSERARDLVAQMLTFSRKGQAGAEPLLLAPMIKESLSMLRHTLPTNIELHTDFEADLPEVMSNPVQLHQLVMNLCINARDAMNGSGVIDIALRRVQIEGEECASCHGRVTGEYIELSVKDNDGGIDSETLERIFDPFFTTKEVGKGTGMGLSMVHGIMHEHGGHIRVDSSPGVGSTFSLLFPQAEERAAVEHEAVEELPPLSDKLLKGRVLVVDDEPAVGGFIAVLLESYGCEVVFETSSQQAYALFQEHPEDYNLLVTDQTMPGMTGVELAQALLDIRPDLPVILCSGYSDQIDSASAKAMGIRGYLSKPIDTPKFLELVKSLLQQ